MSIENKFLYKLLDTKDWDLVIEKAAEKNE